MLSQQKEFNRKLLQMFLFERKHSINSGVYALTQKEMAYNSNKIEGSKLSKEHTRSLFQTRSVYSEVTIRAKDVEEANGHFAMFNRMLDTINDALTEDLIKQFHFNLKIGVFEDRANGYAVGSYKTRRNFVGEISTCDVKYVERNMQRLLDTYNTLPVKTLHDLAKLHVEYECIHPFQDGNGRTGRVLLFRECLIHDIIPFIVQDINKELYIRTLNESATTGDYTNLVSYFEKEQTVYYDMVNEAVL